MTDKEKRELKDGVISIFNRFNILDHTATIGGLRDDILRYIDSLQEEPAEIDFEQELYNYFGQVKDFTLGMRIAKRFYDMGKNSQEPVSEVWHDMSESVENGRNIIIIDPADFYGAVLRKGGSQLKNHNKERYVKWAYIDDLLNLSNVERIGKDWKEPVSEELNEAALEYANNQLIKSGVTDTNCPRELAVAQASLMVNGFKAGTKWQKEQDKETIELAEDHAMLAGMEKMKQEMMAKAINGDITFDYYGDDDKTYGCVAHDSFCLEDFGLKDRDKVKVIVIKED